MEMGLIGKEGVVVRPEALAGRKLGLLNPVRVGIRPNRVRFEQAGQATKRTGRVSGLRAAVRCDLKALERTGSPVTKNKTTLVQLFVGLPVDTVSNCNTLNHAKAISAGLRALKLLGVHGVELPISWGVAVDGGWSSYLAAADMVHETGLKLRVSLNLHASRCPCLPFPQFVADAIKDDPDLLFMDRSGRRKLDCLSFAVDEVPVFDGKKPVEVFEEFFQSFRSAFADHIGTTVTDITIGLGPDGELRYPSLPQSTSGSSFTGVGEFQCYDKYMLADLKRHAEKSGNAMWGLSGPHDTPEYNQSAEFGNFFKDSGGSWETPYGQFFLSWYSEKLLSHASCVLSIGSKVFADLPVTLSSKVPLLHCWHTTRSRPAQLTAGFFSTDNRDGYDAVANIFARNSCAMIISGMDLSDGEQHQDAKSSPQSLLSQIMTACEENGVKVYGENSSLVEAKSIGFSRIKENILSENSGVESFTYHRMGAQFFSPDHWPRFTEFIRNMADIKLDVDDLPSKEEKLSLKMHQTMQAV